MVDVLERLQERDAKTEHKLAVYDDIKFENRGLQVSGQDLKLTDSAYQQFCEQMRIPALYADRCPEDFRNDTFNFWIEQNKGAALGFLTRDDEIASFIKPDYNYVPTVDMYEAFTDAFNDDFDFEIMNSVIDDEFVELVAFSEEFDTTVGNSQVRAGLRVRFSDSWAVTPRFDSYLCRIACMNSALVGLSDRKFRVSGHSAGELIAQTREFSHEALLAVPNMVHGFELLLEQKVTNYVNVVTRICAENKIPRKVRQMLLEAAHDSEFRRTLENDNLGTMYDITNLFTFVASHWQDALTEANILQLFEVAGNLMLTEQQRCGSCGGSKATK